MVEVDWDKFDRYINNKGEETEVSFPPFVEIERAVDRTIKIARQLESRVVLVFKEKRLLVDDKSTPKDVMEKYIFG